MYQSWEHWEQTYKTAPLSLECCSQSWEQFGNSWEQMAITAPLQQKGLGTKSQTGGA